MTLDYSRILVTGASGFVGCRLVEHLVLGLGLGGRVRGTYRRPSHAARLARLGIDLVRLDLGDTASVEQAVAGCDAVVHCAYGTGGSDRVRRAATGAGTARLAQAARRAGVRRFVHLSSVAVWGFDVGPGEIAEERPTRRTGHPYMEGKIDAEEALAEAAQHGLRTVVLRPANVYGPWSAIWTGAPIAALRAGHVALVGRGTAPANTTYVDNLCSAILLGLSDERAVGGTFVVADNDGVSWRGLYEAYAAMIAPSPVLRTIGPEEWSRARGSALGLRALPSEVAQVVRSPEAAALLRLAASRPALRRLGAHAARRVPGGTRRARGLLERPRLVEPKTPGAAHAALLPGEELMLVQTSGALYRSRRLRALGWQPPVALEDALRLTEAWLRFARLL